MNKSFKVRILQKLANLKFATSLLFIISIIVAAGTIIEQDQDLNFYKENYSDNNFLLGLVNWKVIRFFGFDQVYRAWWFFLILTLFVSSLSACTFLNQLPSIKFFKIWKFFNKTKQYNNLKVNDTIKNDVLSTIAFNCNNNKFHFFRQHKQSYAYTGLLGRVAPVVVHFSIIILLGGTTFGALTSFVAQELIPRGEITHIQNFMAF